MSKAKKVTYLHVTPALIAQIEDVIADAKHRTFSISKIYDAHNAALQLKETSQSCPSCLIKRVDALKAWLKDYKVAQGEGAVPAPVTYEDTVKRLALVLGDTPEGERATLETTLSEGYPQEISDEEREVLTARYTALSNEEQLERERLDTLTFTDEEIAALRSDWTEDGATDADFLEVVKGLAVEETDPETKAKYNNLGVQLLRAIGPDAGDHLVSTDASNPGNEITPQYSDPAAPGYVAPGEGVKRVMLQNGDVLDFAPDADNENKGAIKHADGKSVKAAKYVTSDGRNLSVFGGKATFKAEDLT